MDGRLIDLPASKLLDKFGAGSHKPGSGSAAALQGMLASQLLLTVIELTCDPKRHGTYGRHVLRLTEIKARIVTHIYPELERLLHDDAIQFDQVIRLREARNAEEDQERLRALKLAAQQELKLATETPMQIANHCIEVAKAASFVFDRGFGSARGDTGVALHAAVSAVAGSVAIIDLNLLSLEDDDWTKDIRAQLASVRISLRSLNQAARLSEDALADESNKTEQFWREIAKISSALKGEVTATDFQVENLAIRLQQAMWIYFDVYRKKQDRPAVPTKLLAPTKALELLGYRVELVETLGQHHIYGVRSEVAGEIDQGRKTVLLSRRSKSLAVRNFTAAHELGHALLHRQAVLHRDVPLDGTRLDANHIERQADRFATHFLMPKKLLNAMFLELFLAKPFRINDGTAFALVRDTARALRNKCRDAEGLAKELATAEFYDGQRFQSLAKTFNVSPKAMASRLIELELIEF